MLGPLPRRALIGCATALAVVPMRPRAQGVQAAGAAAWPSQPIRLVVPFAPGGTTDLVARLVAIGLQERLGVPVIVENRPGAGATVGSAQVAASPPDGHTLVLSNIASHAISPFLYPGVRYDPVRDFTHVALVTSNPSVFLCRPDFEARGLQEVVALAKARRGGLSVATSGAGSSNHVLVVQFANLTGAPLHHVPYRGSGPALTDTIAGTVELMSDSLPSAAAHLRAGSLRALGTSGESRSAAFPAVPTFREQGVDLVSTSWFGLSGPAGMPRAVTERLNAEVRAVLAQPAVLARYAEFGGTPGTLDAAGYAALVAAEAERWMPLVRASGATAD